VLWLGGCEVSLAEPVGLLLVSTLLFYLTFNGRGQRYISDPIFYLFLSCYLYGTAGYWGNSMLTINAEFLTLDFSDQAYIWSYRATTLSLFGVSIGGLLATGIGSIGNIRPNPTLAKVAFLGSIVAVLFAFSFFYTNSFATDNSHAETLVQKKLESYFPYMLLLIPSFSLLCVKSTKEQRRLVLVILVIFAIINFSGGSRRHVLLMLIVFISSTVLKGQTFDLKKVAVTSVTLIGIGLFVGATRGSIGVAKLFSTYEFLGERMVFGLTEFVRPYVALLYFLDREGQTYLMGTSFFESLKFILPSGLRWYDLPQRLGSQFAVVLQELLNFPRPIGHGFFGIAEVVVNFSIALCLPFFVVFSISIRMLCLIMVKSKCSFMVPVICVVCYGVGRGGFQHIAFYLSYTLAFGILILFSYNFLRFFMSQSNKRNF